MPVVAFTDIYPDGPATEAAGGGAAEGPQTNPDFPGMPVGATPIHRDVAIATATTTTLWTPGANRKFVLTSLMISTDTAMRIAVIDGSDVQSQRIRTLRAAVSGGASPNLVPVPYVSKSAGNSLQVVTGAAGNVDVAVDGWEVDA